MISDSNAEMIGRTISHYRIVGALGKGGMGVVYKAEDTRLNRAVALKFLPPGEYEEEEDRERLLREARTAALIHHPNICPIYDIEEAGGRLFFAMAYLEGQTVEQMNRTRIGTERAIDIAIQVAAGLAEAHRHQIVHRDIKGSNIVVSEQGHASILDFGIARRDDGVRLTSPGKVVGTVAYMSPEQAQGLEVDHRADIWALGVVLFEMLTGRLPFHRNSALGTMHAIVHDDPVWGEPFPLEAGPALRRIVDTALAKAPTQRFRTAQEMGSALSELVSMRPSSLRSNEFASTVLMALPPKRKSRAVALTVLATMAILGAGGYGVFRLRTPAALPEEKNIAVLPFEVIGGDPGVRAIADGLVEVLTAQMSEMEQFHGKALIFPASEIRARKIHSAEEARRIYGANLVITGSAQRVGNSIQFTVALIETARLRQLGARTFDIDAGSPIALRDGALTRVLNLLQVHFAPDSRRGSGPGDTADPAAYNDYLKGVGFYSRYDISGNLDRAIASFESAIEHDPKYAAAFASLATAYIRKASYNLDKSWFDRAVESGEKAVGLNPRMADGHARLGAIYGQVGREEDAIREFKRSLQLAPGNPEAYRELAGVLTNLGRFTEAEALYLESTALRPNDWYGHVLLGLFYVGRDRYAEAEVAYRRALELTPDNAIAHRLMGALYKGEGRYPLAVEQFESALKLQKSPLIYNALGLTYFYERRFNEAAAALDTASKLDATQYIYWGNLGMTLQKLPGRKAEGDGAIRRAIRMAETLLAITPKDYSIHSDLAEYHARVGEAPQAAREIESIPAGNRSNFLAQLADVYELTGQREKAVNAILELPSRAALIDPRHDPDLQGLWKDEALLGLLRKKWTTIPN